MATAERDSSKGFDSQLLPEGEPNAEWGIEQLNVFAQMRYRQLTDGEKSLTVAYWRLGHALVLVKKVFKHGHWGQHLKDLGIDKTRAAKATAIYKTFAKEEDVGGLRVDEAYAQRERKQITKQTEETGSDVAMKKDAKVLQKSIGNIAKKTGVVVHDAAYAEPKDAVILIPAVRKAIRELEELLRFLEEQATKAVPEEQTASLGAVATARSRRRINRQLNKPGKAGTIKWKPT